MILRGSTNENGLTRVEVLAIVVSCLILMAITYPQLVEGRARARRIQCVSNLKPVALAHRIFYNGSDEIYPYAVPELHLYGFADSPEGQGGNPLIFQNPDLETWHYFQVLSNELGSPKILVCPSDRQRVKSIAKDFGQGEESFSSPVYQNRSLSYFLGLNASEVEPQTILLGDRNLAGPTSTGPAMDVAAPYISGGTQLLGPNDPEGAKRTWSKAIPGSFHHNLGNVALADGSVQQLGAAKLEEKLERSRQAYGTNSWLFSFPNDPAPIE